MDIRHILSMPQVKKMVNLNEIIWTNPKYINTESGLRYINLSMKDVMEASHRLTRFSKYIEKVFPETKVSTGLIESPILEIENMRLFLANKYNLNIEKKLYIKLDSHLPISGSIKARGGIYEVLKYAETIAVNKGLLTYETDYSIFDSKPFKNLFSEYTIAVGSTGNLGLSIGIISAQLGFKVCVHMSKDAKRWKKELLREKGVTVVEYDSDYSKAVEEGRKHANNKPKTYFIDDENSKDLFLGYSVAALRLKNQLDTKGINISKENPLYVYLPCGVGGGPGGVAFGLKLIYGDYVQCYFAEPTHSPCMALGMITGLHDKISVQDIGIDNITDADGLAVGRPSGFVGKSMERLISGCYTVTDENLYILLKYLRDYESIELEPSAIAGLWGPIKFKNNKPGVHLAWSTGGSMVPKDVMYTYYKKGEYLIK